MRRSLRWSVGLPGAVIAAALLTGGCTSLSGAATATRPAPTAVPSPDHGGPSAAPASTAAGGDPRTGGYWEMWSSCGKNSQASTAKANGGRDAGWILADDLLADPGIEVGPLRVGDCAQGLRLLQNRTVDGSDRSSSPVFRLAGQLYTAELNLAAGARTCADLEGTAIAGQALLAKVGFDGSAIASWSMADDATATRLAQRLAEYNAGGLCR